MDSKLPIVAMACRTLHAVYLVLSLFCNIPGQNTEDWAVAYSHTSACVGAANFTGLTIVTYVTSTVPNAGANLHNAGN